MRTYEILKNGKVEILTAQELVNRKDNFIIITDNNRTELKKLIRDSKLKSLGL